MPDQLVPADNSVLTGTINDQIRKKGAVTIEVNSKKTKYKAGDINGVQINQQVYITKNYTFFEVAWKGKIAVCCVKPVNLPAFNTMVQSQ